MFRRAALAIAVGLVAGALLVAVFPGWLRVPAQALVAVDEPFPSDLVVVLAGDLTGDRMTRGAQLVDQGLAPRVLVSAPPAQIYGSSECDLAIAFAERRGHPRGRFECLDHEGVRTLDEATLITAELTRRRVRRAMLVTSDFHTRRAGRVYRSLTTDIEFRVIGVTGSEFRVDEWWHSGPGRKRFVMEWLSTLAYLVGL